jgi:ADP-ribose pyrophosphatase YjhB (NUDIX family)
MLVNNKIASFPKHALAKQHGANTPELRDLYDAHRQKTGETIRKDAKIPKGKYYLTVVAWIGNSKNQLLLQLTSPQKHHQWSATGGHPKAGETSEEGIIAEIKEELGFKIKKSELTKIQTLRITDDFIDIYFIKKDLNLSDARLQKSEVEKIGWFTLSETENLIKTHRFLQSHRIFFDILKNYLNLFH